MCAEPNPPDISCLICSHKFPDNISFFYGQYINLRYYFLKIQTRHRIIDLPLSDMKTQKGGIIRLKIAFK